MIKPINDFVLIELAPINETTSGGIILTTKRQTRDQTGIVLAVGPKVKENINVGDKIHFENGAFQPLKKVVNSDKELALVKEGAVVGVYE